MRPRRPTHDLVRAAAALALLLLGLSAESARADTIYLKDGTQILDCQIVSENATAVTVRTSVGQMVVPRTEIFRIQKVKTVIDHYQEKLAALREGDVRGLYALAEWCRTKPDLRKESDDLLAKVIELEPKHTGARRLLGHIRVERDWVVPEPLALEVKINATGRNAVALRERLALFLATRRDVRLAPAPVEKGSIEGCVVDVSVVVTQRAASKLYGEAIGRPMLAASVVLQARGDWLGKKPVKASADGQVPAGGANASDLAIQNALGSGSQSLHRFLDQLQAARAKQLAKDLADERREERKRERAERTTVSRA